MTKDSVNTKAFHPLQSWEWGEFRERWGNKIVRTDDFLIIFSLIPHTSWKIGTLIKGPKPTIKLINQVREIGQKENALFVKLEPNVLKNEEDLKLLDKVCVPGKRLFTPTSFWIDLTLSEEDLLKSFSSKTRYNIRLAQKHGVEVIEDNSDKAFEKYLELTFATAKRQGFFAHTRKYHQLMWQILKPAGIAHLLTASYKGEILTTWILFSWKDWLYYPYGASSDEHKEVMANNLMMWKAIRFGKKLGLKAFDLWGREEGKGFTKFKEGYNPKVVEFLGSWDVVINKPLYQLYRLIENLRWLMLRFPSKFNLAKAHH
jgi:lipid II:glycine glycyltransferase (peptidoglycan interpeptide bridge formation enzyme)